jgi:hypothetical protein
LTKFARVNAKRRRVLGPASSGMTDDFHRATPWQHNSGLRRRRCYCSQPNPSSLLARTASGPSMSSRSLRAEACLTSQTSTSTSSVAGSQHDVTGRERTDVALSLLCWLSLSRSNFEPTRYRGTVYTTYSNSAPTRSVWTLGGPTLINQNRSTTSTWLY